MNLLKVGTKPLVGQPLARGCPKIMSLLEVSQKVTTRDRCRGVRLTGISVIIFGRSIRNVVERRCSPDLGSNNLLQKKFVAISETKAFITLCECTTVNCQAFFPTLFSRVLLHNFQVINSAYGPKMATVASTIFALPPNVVRGLLLLQNPQCRREFVFHYFNMTKLRHYY